MTLPSTSGLNGSDGAQPRSKDIGSPFAQEQPPQRIEAPYQSPYMNLALQDPQKHNLELLKSYQKMTSELVEKVDRFDVGRLEGVISQVQTQKVNNKEQHILGMKVKRLLPAIGYIKPLVTTIAKLDPHQIAPYVCAGVFFALEVP